MLIHQLLYFINRGSKKFFTKIDLIHSLVIQFIMEGSF